MLENGNPYLPDDDEQQYYKPKKFNKPVVGLLAGLIFPLIIFIIYFFIRTSGEKSFSDYVLDLVEYELFTAILTLCVLPNLLLFVLFNKLDYWYSVKGIIIAIFIYLLVVLVLKFGVLS